MPVKLLGTIIVAVFVAVFTGLNLDNKCNVWLFKNFEEVNVALTIGISFLAGVIVILPFTFGKKLGAVKPSPKEIALAEKEARKQEKLHKKEEKLKLKEEKRKAKLASVPASTSSDTTVVAPPESTF